MIIQKTYNQNHSILYYVELKTTPTGPVPTDPSQDPQYAEWRNVQAWTAKQAATSSIATASGTPPTLFDNVHTQENKPTVKIISPTNNAIITGNFLSTDIQASAPRGIATVNYYINDNLFVEKSAVSST